MNQNNNNIFNKNEIENKLKNFKEGKDYSVSPTDEPNIKTYNFHNDKLRSMFRYDRVPVRITREAYDGKDYTYRGHFEEGKDYYSRQEWNYSKDYQHKPGEWFPVSEWVHSEYGEDYIKGSIRGRRLEDNFEPKKIEPNSADWDFFGNNLGWSEEQRIKDLKEKVKEWKQKLDYLEKQPRNEKINWEIERFRKDIKDAEDTIRHLESRKNGVSRQPDWIKYPVCDTTFNKDAEVWGVQDDYGFQPTCCHDCAEKYAGKPDGKVVKSGSDEYFRRDGKSTDLQKENQELRQQLAEVQKQLTEVLEELRKLKNNSSSQNGEKLEQQIIQNEKLIKNGKEVSVAEVQEQVNKSQALMNEINTAVSQPDNKGNGSLPYVIGGSVILASAGIIGYLLVKKNKQK